VNIVATRSNNVDHASLSDCLIGFALCDMNPNSSLGQSY
jgi:hypothetical protein